MPQPAWTAAKRNPTVFIWMAAIFITCLIVADLTGAMLFSFTLALPFGGTSVLLSAGIIPFPITFILTDLLNEFYGQSGARFVTWLGFGMLFLTYGLLWTASQLPVDARTLITKPVFLVIFNQYAGMFLASMTAYLIGQLLDISVFHWFKSITGNKMIWLRATGSTVISQLFDSFIVTGIAFWGQMTLFDMLQLASGNYVWKFIVAVAITPLLYIGHALLNRYFVTKK
ncbi:MAG: queuosine precursor transporter [Cyanobacteria bacterium P01_H01_bin.74]